jgi:hypothetical protein
MKTRILAFLVSLSGFLVTCTSPVLPEPEPAPVVHSWFNQVNIALDESHANCLLDQWYGSKYANEPIVFRLINDAATYRAFFPCTLTTPLPSINFATRSLLIGMRGEYGQFTVKTPVNISSIVQTLTPTTDDDYVLQVKVSGKASKDSPGTEWFAFVAVAPKITGKVTLDMQYQFK